MECGVFDVGSMKCVSDDSYVNLVIIESRLNPGKSVLYTAPSSYLSLSYLKYCDENIQQKNFASCLCECGTRSLSLMKVHSLRVLENGILRKIVECEREDVTNTAVYIVFLF